MDSEANPVIHLVASRASTQSKTPNTTTRAHDAGSRDGLPPVEATESDASEIYPGDRGDPAAWLVLLGSFLALFPSFGLMVSIGTLQEYWQSNQLTGYSSRDVGWISGIFVYLALGLGLCFGPIFDRYGPRTIMVVGSIAYTVSIFLLAECSQYYQFMLCLGLLAGPAAAALTTTALAVVSHWFKRRRGLASGIAMVGNSFGGVLVPLVLRHALPKYGYAWSVRIIAFVFLACLLVANMLVRSRFSPSAEAKNAKLFSLELFGQGSFTFLTISVFGIEIVLFGALGILPTYASLSPDYPAATGFYLIAVLNATSCFGRILPGFISDYVGRFNTLGAMMFATLLVMLVIWLPFGHTSLAALYVFAAFFGFGTGSWMAMVPATLASLSGPYHFGRYFGTCYFVASLATLICIPISGELVESVGPQALVGFMSAVLAVSIGTFALSRWALLGRQWKWKTII